MSEVVKLKWNEGSKVGQIEGASTSDMYIPFGADQKMVILLKNHAAELVSVTIKAGTGIQATEDIKVSVGDMEEVALCLESGKFLITEGEHKGCVHLTSDVNIGVNFFELP